MRRLLRLAMLGSGLGRAACTCVALALASYAADRAFRLPHGARLLLLLSGAGCLAWRLARDVVRPLALALPDEALALEVERRWGGRATCWPAPSGSPRGAGGAPMRCGTT